jgi:hypothetical protein
MTRFPILVSVLVASGAARGLRIDVRFRDEARRTREGAPASAATVSVEDPDKRNERLLRLEFSGDQWWGRPNVRNGRRSRASKR